MTSFRTILKYLNRFYLTILFWSVPLFAFAKKVEAAPKYEEPAWSTYMLCYMLVVLCLLLAMLVVCNPIHRRDKPLKKDEM